MRVLALFAMGALVLGGTIAALEAVAPHAAAATGSGCTNFVASNTTSQWRKPGATSWSLPSQVQPNPGGAWTAFPSGGAGSPTPLPIWANNLNTTSAFDFRDTFSACGGKYVLDITADNNFLAWVNTTDTTSGAQVDSCLDPTGHCFTGYHHSNFTPSCTTCQISVRGVNFGAYDMVQYRLQACSGTLTTSAALAGTLGNNGWYRSAVTATITQANACGSPDTYWSLDGSAFTKFTTVPGIVSITGDGTHTLQYYTVDGLGQEPTKTTPVKIDATVPSSCTGSYSGTLGSNGWYKTTGSETLTRADATSGVATTAYVLDGGASTTYSAAFAITGDSAGHTLTCTVTDNAGNTATFTIPSIKIDTTAPTCAGSYSGTLGTNGWYKTTGSETLTRTDATSGIASTTYSLHSGASTTYSAPFAITGDSSGHTISCTVTDNAGNPATLSLANVKIDTTAPSACTGTYSGTVGTNGWYKTTGSETLAGADAMSGVAGTTYVLDGGASTAYSSPFSVSGDGTHTLTCTVTDNAGNVASFTLAAIKIDTTVPTCAGSYSGTLGNAGWYKTAGSETLTGSDATSGVGSTTYTLNGGSSTAYSAPFSVASQGTNTIVCTVVDNAGNSGGQTFTVKLDSVAPSSCTGSFSGTVGSNGWFKTSGSETLTDADATSGIASTTYVLDSAPSATYSSPFSISGDGTHTITCTATDNAGNSATFTLASVKIDSVAPTCAGSYSGTLGNAGWYKTAGSETLTGSDATSGVGSTTYTLNGGSSTAYSAPFSVASQGTNTIVCTVVDNAGNSGGQTFTVKLDSVAPSSCTGSFSGTVGSNGWFKTSGSDTLTDADATSGVATTTYVLDGAPSATYGSPFAITGDSSGHTLTCTVTDVAGNAATFTLAAIKIDTTPPSNCSGSYSGTHGNNGWYVVAGSETLTGADATSGVGSIKYVLDGGASAAYGGAFGITGDSTGHTLSCTVTDNAGNRASFTLASIKIDTTPPSDCQGSFSGTLGDNGWYVTNGSETLTGFDATSGPGPMTYVLDGAPSASYAGAFLVTGDSQGHTVVCTVTDNAGNTAPAFALAAIKIDTTPPNLAFATPLEGRTYVDDVETTPPVAPPHTTIVGGKTVIANASDAMSGVDRVLFYVDGTLRASATSAPYTWSWAAGNETPGDHDLSMRAYDKAGNPAYVNMTVTTAPDPFDVICKDVPPVIETIRTPGGFVVGLLGGLIPLPDEITRIVEHVGIVCDPPMGYPGGPGNPCGEIRAQELNTTVAATVSYSVDPNGIIHVYWCIWANSTTTAPAGQMVGAPVADPTSHQYVGTYGRLDYVYTVDCSAPVEAYGFVGNIHEGRAFRVNC
ncbi:MAG: beta strand repeat-containing protein [Thermoplasmatota archaeon]